VARNDPVDELVERLELPFNEWGMDLWGVSRRHLKLAARAAVLLYRHYFDVRVHGIEHVPPRGRAMLVGNHSGGVALDGLMVIVSMLLEMEPPRLAQAMVERFIPRIPFFNEWTWRTGQITGMPEHAVRLLEQDRLLVIFPEGIRGTAKLYSERHSLVEFGTGFVRLALQTRSPIIPLGFVGGGAAIPTVANLYRVGRLFGVPYIPITPWGLPLPRPGRLDIVYGEPLHFEGTGNEDDHVIGGYVEQVKARIASLIEQGRALRRQGS
jgi:1-acyl-sn-glycerol-3-phosphate acyltransferase